MSLNNNTNQIDILSKLTNLNNILKNNTINSTQLNEFKNLFKDISNFASSFNDSNFNAISTDITNILNNNTSLNSQQINEIKDKIKSLGKILNKNGFDWKILIIVILILIILFVFFKIKKNSDTSD